MSSPDAQARDKRQRLTVGRAAAVMTSDGGRLWLVVYVATALARGLFESLVLLTLVVTAGALADETGAVNLAIGPIDLSLTVRQGAALGGLAVLGLVASSIPSVWLGARMAARSLETVRTRLVHALMDASWERQSAVIHSNLQDLAATHAVRTANLVVLLASLTTSTITLAVLVGAALALDPVMAGTLCIVIVALAVVFRPLLTTIRKRSEVFIVAHHAYIARLSETFAVLAELRIFGVRDAAAEKLEDDNRRAVVEFQYTRIRGLILPILYVAATASLLLGGLAVASTKESIDIARFGAIVIFLLRSLRYSQGLQTTWQGIWEHLPYYESIDAALREWKPDATARGEHSLERVDTIELRDVSYTYPTGQVGIEGMTATLHRGEIVGLNGPSGAGKSTIAQIVLGLRRPTRGEYLVNGDPIATYTDESWYRRLAYVAQEPRLLDGDIRDNIRFLRASVSEDDIDRAVVEAGLEPDIDAWPDGLARRVGSGGRELSGGQRQRVAIARALAGRPDVVVMDEPTSALDADAEQIVRHTIDALRGRVMVLLIAHRPSTLSVCDRVFTVRAHRADEHPRWKRGEGGDSREPDSWDFSGRES